MELKWDRRRRELNRMCGRGNERLRMSLNQGWKRMEDQNFDHRRKLTLEEATSTGSSQVLQKESEASDQSKKSSPVKEC